MNTLYRWVPLCWLIVSSPFSFGQTPTENYSTGRKYKQAGIYDNFRATCFVATSHQASNQETCFDGLGKPMQQVKSFGAGSKADIVKLVEYDGSQPPVRAFLHIPVSSEGRELRISGYLKSCLQANNVKDSNVSAPIGAKVSSESFSSPTFYEDSPLICVTGRKVPRVTKNSTQFHGLNAVDKKILLCLWNRAG
jgi:hypothetical protein